MAVQARNIEKEQEMLSSLNSICLMDDVNIIDSISGQPPPPPPPSFKRKSANEKNGDLEICITDDDMILLDDEDDKNSRYNKFSNNRSDKERSRKDRDRIGRGRRDRNRDRNKDRFRKDDKDRPWNRSQSNHSNIENVSAPPIGADSIQSMPPINQQSQRSHAISPWAAPQPLWGPMPPQGPGAPIPPQGPGLMGGPVTSLPPQGPPGLLGCPVGPMPPMSNPLQAANEPPPITGAFRITLGMFGWMMGPDGITVPVKNAMQFKDCVLQPPNRMAPTPSTRERPLGCRTIFVGGIPEKATEENVIDVFERCGDVTTVRLSKKNFCHIRYELESFVENAIFLSGYRMRINNSTDNAYTGRLHVDYAQARDDQYEYECRQRQLQREQRHRERMEAERLRPPSPPPVVHFSDHEASLVSEQLKGDEKFLNAAQVLLAWLERGDCSKRNSGVFYSMIQSANSHVRRLIGEKEQYEEELNKFREQTKARILGVTAQFGQVESVFKAACHKKVWDHFTKAQRRNIEVWKKQAQEIKTIQLSESDKYENSDEMEVVSDNEENETPYKKAKKSSSSENELKEENESLKCQLEAYKNEVDLIKGELRTEMTSREEQIEALKKTLQAMQQTLTLNASKKREDDLKLTELKKQLELVNENSRNDAVNLNQSSESQSINQKSALLIGLISTFLHVHPKGASPDYIWSYIQQFDKEITPSEIESLLVQFRSVFKQTMTGVGACLERKWSFTGFDQQL